MSANHLWGDSWISTLFEFQLKGNVLSDIFHSITTTLGLIAKAVGFLRISHPIEKRKREQNIVNLKIRRNRYPTENCLKLRYIYNLENIIPSTCHIFGCRSLLEVITAIICCMLFRCQFRCYLHRLLWNLTEAERDKNSAKNSRS